MSNPLFNQLNNNMPAPFSNMANLFGMFNDFKKNFRGDPKAQVQQMLDSGQITQEQFNQVSQMATQFQKMLK